MTPEQEQLRFECIKIALDKFPIEDYLFEAERMYNYITGDTLANE